MTEGDSATMGRAHDRWPCMLIASTTTLGGLGPTMTLCNRYGLANPVHLDDHHLFAADVGQVDEH